MNSRWDNCRVHRWEGPGSDGLRSLANASQPRFVLLSLSPRSPSCDSFLGSKCQGRSHDCQPSRATIKLASKVNAVKKSWGNLPWLPFNKKNVLHNSVRKETPSGRRGGCVCGSRSACWYLQGPWEHVPLTLCHCEPLHGSDDPQNHRSPAQARSDILIGLLLCPCDDQGSRLAAHSWVELGFLIRVQVKQISTVFTQHTGRSCLTCSQARQKMRKHNSIIVMFLLTRLQHMVAGMQLHIYLKKGVSTVALLNFDQKCPKTSHSWSQSLWI